MRLLDGTWQLTGHKFRLTDFKLPEQPHVSWFFADFLGTKPWTRIG